MVVDMAGVPRVVASGELVARVDDVPVHLLTVEAWAGRLAVRLVGVPDDETRHPTGAHDAALVEWHTSGAADAGIRPPRSPADVLFQSVKLSAEQGGVPLRLMGWSCGGTGTEWLGQWSFESGTDMAVGMVRLTVETDDGRWSESFDLAA